MLFEDRQIQNVIKNSNANIVTVTPEFFVLEKTGRRRDVDALFHKLEPYGLMQFTRSGSIAITKEKMNISKMLEEFA